LESTEAASKHGGGKVLFGELRIVGKKANNLRDVNLKVGLVW